MLLWRGGWRSTRRTPSELNKALLEPCLAYTYTSYTRQQVYREDYFASMELFILDECTYLGSKGKERERTASVVMSRIDLDLFSRPR